MVEFQPPEVEQAYLRVTENLIPDVFWKRVPEQSEIDEMSENVVAQRAELQSDGLLGLTAEEVWMGPEGVKERVLSFHRLESMARLGVRTRDLDVNMREVISFVLQGLSDRSLDELMVEFDSNKEFGEEDWQPGGVSDVPYAISIHPTTEKLGKDFAAKAGYIAALLLTPDVVRLVLADKTRETPKIPRKLNVEAGETSEVTDV